MKAYDFINKEKHKYMETTLTPITSNLGKIITKHNPFDILDYEKNLRIRRIDPQTGIENETEGQLCVIYEGKDILIKESVSTVNVDRQDVELLNCIKRLLLRIIASIESFDGEIKPTIGVRD